MTYGNLRADCQYTGISSGPKARYEVWESLYLFGRSLVKRFAVCYRTVVLSVLSVTLMYCGQTVGRIKMKLGMQIGLGHIVLDGAQTQFSAHVYCGHGRPSQLLLSSF